MKPLPDPYPIEPLTKPPNCTISVPGSKSITNRALILAALSKEKCTLRGALWADDTQVMVDSLQKLGFDVKVSPDPAEECNRTIEVVGRGGEIPAKKADLYVGNAGTAARFLTAFVCLGHGEYKISGDPRMRERPMEELFGALKQLGAEIEAANNRLPATIYARGLASKKIAIDVSRSSQFASALILIGQQLPLAEMVVQGGESDVFDYIQMSARMVRDFQAGDYLIEPDLSGASYFKAVEFIVGGKADILGWPDHPLQMDGKFTKYLPPPPTISRLGDLGDSVMTLAVCALFGTTPMLVHHAGHMRLQESDRISALVTELRRVGARAEEMPNVDGFAVYPVQAGQLHGAEIETYNDHRMAMCFAVLGLKVPGIRIKNPGCVSKTFPNFFEKLEQLRQQPSP